MSKYQLTILTVLIFLFTIQLSAQNDSGTVYKNLEIKKFYTVSLYSDQHGYEVNGKKVTKTEYDKFAKSWKEMESCCPCILKSYDENDILIREAVSCTDCVVGYFKEFYPNGNLKFTGRYKENPTDNWNDIWERGFCSLRDGEWIYYDEQGIKLYSEYWKEGNFISQIPEQSEMEIWKVSMTLNGKDANGKTDITPSQMNQLVFTPFFKNHSRNNLNLSVEFTTTAIGKRTLKHRFNPDSLKYVDFDELLKNGGFTSEDKVTYNFSVLNNTETVAHFYCQSARDIYTVKDTTPNQDLYLVNASGNGKKVWLKPVVTYELGYENVPRDSAVEEHTVTISGYIEKLDSASLSYSIVNENIYLRYKNGIESYTQKYSTDIFNNFGNNEYRKVNLNSLKYLDYTSPRRDAVRTAGYTITVISGLATLIAAPLVSIDYKNGGFNKNRYFTVAGYGLAGISIGIPLIVLSQPKRYRLTTKGMNTGKSYWYLEARSNR